MKVYSGNLQGVCLETIDSGTDSLILQAQLANRLVGRMQRSLFLLWNDLLNQVPIVGLNKTFFLLSGDLPHPPTV